MSHMLTGAGEEAVERILAKEMHRDRMGRSARQAACSWCRQASSEKLPSTGAIAHVDTADLIELRLLLRVCKFECASRCCSEPRLWQVGYDGRHMRCARREFRRHPVGVVGAHPILGAWWSGAITRKEGHHIVETGPYALVRHPIYTGLIAANFATAAAQATVTGLIGAALVAIGLWLKARVEENFLTAELGADAYAAYRRRVPMLVRFYRTDKTPISAPT